MWVPDLKGKKVLIAEDNIGALLLLKAFLEPTGAEIFEARNGIEALRVFSQNQDITIIFLDIFMPEMDGLETVSKIREINKHVPIVAQTAFVSRIDKERCLAAGFSAYLSKPIDLQEFYNTLWYFLG